MKMKKNWFKKLMKWLNLMNEEVFTYNNIFLKNISEISGDKVVLKNKSIDDFAKDYIWRTDPELATLDASYPLDISFKSFIKAYKSEIKKNEKNTARFSIFSNEDRHIGNSMLYNINHFSKSMELGIMIGDKNHWNKGYGSDTIKTMIKHIFKHTDYHKIYLHTLKWNLRAQSSFKKSGFSNFREVSREGKKFIYMEINKQQT